MTKRLFIDSDATEHALTNRPPSVGETDYQLFLAHYRDGIPRRSLADAYGMTLYRVTDILAHVKHQTRIAWKRRASGAVLIDRARLDRLLRCAEASHEWFNAPYNPDAEAGGEVWAAADQALGNAAKALQPGDLDPLP